MRLRISLRQAREEIGHLLSQIPTIKRPAVNDRELIRQPQFFTPPLALLFAEAKTIEIDATRNHFMMRLATAQSVPLANDRPDLLGQRHDRISRGENLPFS